MKKQTAIATVFFLFLSLAAVSGAGRNLLSDASFEDQLPLWFEILGHRSFYAAKRIDRDAPDGKTVLSIQGWPKNGCRLFSPVIEKESRIPELPGMNMKTAEDDDLAELDTNLEAEAYSLSVKIRSFGPAPGPEVTFSLFDTKGHKKLLPLGTVSLAGQGKWQSFTVDGKEPEQELKAFRLGIQVRGPADARRDRRIELDQIGLFAAATPEKVTDNSDTTSFEAETLADGVAWTRLKHYGGWYQGTPSNLEMLAGFRTLKPGIKTSVSRMIHIRESGDHRLWIRYLTSTYPGDFTVAVRQKGKNVAVHTFNGVAEGKYRWGWCSLLLKPQPGKAELVLSRPRWGSSWITRKLDLFVLTNNLDYQPNFHDFMPGGYLRFTNLSENQEPFCLWGWIRRHRSPWYANAGMLSLAGNSEGYSVPRDPALWLAKGDTSPWIKISNYLLFAGGRNNVSFTATRKTHTNGFVQGPIKGKLEFAVGREHKIIKTITVDQDVPRIILSLPANFARNPDKIRDPWVFIRKKQDVLKSIPDGERAKSLNLFTTLSMGTQTIDSKVLTAELDILKKLGFNGLYRLITPASQALNYYQKINMKPVFSLAATGSWESCLNPDPFHPDTEKLTAYFKKLSESYSPVREQIDKIKVMDEPGGMTYEKIANSEPLRLLFRNELKKKGFTPEQLGVFSWDKVVPVVPEQSDEFPKLYYHSALFRLQGNVNLSRAIVAAKNKFFPATARTYVNYAPTWSGSNLVQRGTDPFLLQRHGGLEMLWTEDWLGYGAGLQQASALYALLRSAGSPTHQPLGVYVVGADARNATLLRMKIFTALAGGARTLVLYSYGPAYVGIDSWSMIFKLYPELAKSLHELSHIDQGLKGTHRRPTDIAILYNRTASIWEKKKYVSEQNAQFTFWALTHAGYDADFLAEEDLLNGKLKRYKLLYIDGLRLRRDAAKKIADWVKAGGILCGSAGAAIRDEYNQPMNILNPVFSLKKSHFPKPEKDAPVDTIPMQSAGRPKYELRKLKTLGTLSTPKKSAVPPVTFKQLCLQETLKPTAAATVILKTEKGECAGIRSPYGKGTAIRLAGLPGISYLNEAMTAKDYNPNTYLPRKFSRSLRDFIVWPAKLAGAARIADSADPILEIVRYDAKNRAVIFVIDHEATEKDALSFRLFDAGSFTKAHTATGNPVKLEHLTNRVLQLTLPLNTADAIVLE